MAGERGDDQVEGVGRVAAVAARVGEGLMTSRNSTTEPGEAELRQAGAFLDRVLQALRTPAFAPGAGG